MATLWSEMVACTRPFGLGHVVAVVLLGFTIRAFEATDGRGRHL